MVEYIAKTLAIELMRQSSYLSNGDLLEVNGNLAKARIEAEPAADLVPVVRCRDCEWAMKSTELPGWYMCKCEEAFDYYAKPDDFCSHGKRKEHYD